MPGGEEDDCRARRPRTKGKRASAWRLLFLSCFLCCGTKRSEDSVEAGQGTRQKTHDVPSVSENPQNLSNKEIKKKVKQGQARRKKQGKAWYSCFLRKSTSAPQPDNSTEETCLPQTSECTQPDKSNNETAVPQNNKHTQPDSSTKETAIPQTNEHTQLDQSIKETAVPKSKECTQPEKSIAETAFPHSSESTRNDKRTKESAVLPSNECTTITTIAQQSPRWAEEDTMLHKEVKDTERCIDQCIVILYRTPELFQVNLTWISLPLRPEDIMRAVAFQGPIRRCKIFSDITGEPNKRALEWHPVIECRTEQVEKAAEKNMRLDMGTKKTRWLSFLKGRSFSLKKAITNILMVCTILILWFCATGLSSTGEMHHALD